MFFGCPPEIFQGRSISTPRNQRNLLDKQKVNGASANPRLDVPSDVVAALEAFYTNRDEIRRKRNAEEASLTFDTRAVKAARTEQAAEYQALSSRAPSPHGPATPDLRDKNVATIDDSVLRSSPPNTDVSWSPSPQRSPKQRRMVPPTKPIPSRLPPPNFPSSGPEEPLEVELPRAQDEHLPGALSQKKTPSSIYSTQPRIHSFHESPCAAGTPPCGQPGQTSGSHQVQRSTPQRRFKSITLNPEAIDVTSDDEYDDTTACQGNFAKRVSSDKSSVPSSSNVVPASMSPPPGQSVLDPRWPAPVLPRPKSSVPRSSDLSRGASQDIVGMTQAEGDDALASSPSKAMVMPTVHTMSYVSPDVASSNPHASLGHWEGEGATLPQNSPGGPDESVHLKLIQPFALSGGTLKDGNTFSSSLAATRTAEPSHKDQPEAANGMLSEDPQPMDAATHKIAAASSRIQSHDQSHDLINSDLKEVHAGTLDQANVAASTMEKPVVAPTRGALTDSAVCTTSTIQKSQKVSFTFNENSESPFETFCKVYPAYAGNLTQFVKACYALKHIARERSLHTSLWDDFVGVWPNYAQYAKTAPPEAKLVAADWYNDRDEDPYFTKRLIGKRNLETILDRYDKEVERVIQGFHKQGPRNDSSGPRTTSILHRSPSRDSIGSKSRQESLEQERHGKTPQGDHTRVNGNMHVVGQKDSPARPHQDTMHSVKKSCTTPTSAAHAQMPSTSATLRHRASTTVVAETPASEHRFPTADQDGQSTVDRTEISIPLVTNTPVSRNRAAPHPPEILSTGTRTTSASMVQSDALRSQGTNSQLQKRNIGTDSKLGTRGTPESVPNTPRTASPASKPRPSSSAKSSVPGAKYFQRFMKSRKSLQKEAGSSAARQTPISRSSLSKSDASG